MRFVDKLVDKVAERVKDKVTARIVNETANMLGKDYEQLDYKLNSYTETLYQIEIRVQKIEIALKLLGAHLTK